MQTENLSNLTLNYLTETEYNQAKSNGELEENQLYMTPDDSSSGGSSESGGSGAIKLVDLTLTEDTQNLKIEGFNLTANKIYELYILGGTTESDKDLNIIYNDLEEALYYNVYEYFSKTVGSGFGYDVTDAIKHYVTSHKTNAVKGIFMSTSATFVKVEIGIRRRTYFNYESKCVNFGVVATGLGVYSNPVIGNTENPADITSLTFKNATLSAGTQIMLFERSA